MQDYRLAAAQGMLWGIAVSAILWGIIIGTCYVVHNERDAASYTLAIRK
jgi:hypothetical protein